MALAKCLLSKTLQHVQFFKVPEHTYIPSRGVSPYSYYIREFAVKHCLVLKKELLKNSQTPISTNGIGIFNYSRPYLYKYEAFRTFKVSPRRGIHPMVWVVFRPVLKVVAALGGRVFRKWWRDLPLNKRKHFLEVLKSNRMKILASSGAIGIGILIYYENHVQETPITKRRRFIAFTQEQSQEMADMAYAVISESHGPNFLHPDLPISRRIRNIVLKLVNANKDFPEFYDKKWSVVVINDQQQNAYALSNGFVFIHSGMIDLCANDDQLAVVMAHEVAHCVLQHAAEQMSFAHIVDFGVIIVVAAIWAILPSDSVSLLINWLFNNFVEVTFHLPYSRVLETEADEVGMYLAAKACFDVRQSSAFWTKMAILNKQWVDSPSVEWLSTHPANEKRSEHLDNRMNEALELRRSCGCPPLYTADPRLDPIGQNKAGNRPKWITVGHTVSSPV